MAPPVGLIGCPAPFVWTIPPIYFARNSRKGRITPPWVDLLPMPPGGPTPAASRSPTSSRAHDRHRRRRCAPRVGGRAARGDRDRHPVHASGPAGVRPARWHPAHAAGVRPARCARCLRQGTSAGAVRCALPRRSPPPSPSRAASLASCAGRRACTGWPRRATRRLTCRTPSSLARCPRGDRRCWGGRA